MLGKGNFWKILSIMFLLVAVIGAGMGIRNMAAIRPASDYEDKGVYEFIPYRVLPAQRENTGAVGRQRRLHPTKTVYVLHYKAQGHSSYRYITVEPELTAETYTRNQQYKYIWIIGCSLLYIVYFAVYGRKRLGF